MEAMASAYAEDHPAVALGAKKGADQPRERLLLLLESTQRLPRDMGGLGDLMGMRELASDMVAAVQAASLLLRGVPSRRVGAVGRRWRHARHHRDS